MNIENHAYIFFNYKLMKISGFVNILNKEIILTNYPDDKNIELEFMCRLLNTIYNINECSKAILNSSFKYVTISSNFLKELDLSNYKLKFLKKYDDLYFRYNEYMFAINIYRSSKGICDLLLFNKFKYTTLNPSEFEEILNKKSEVIKNNITNLNLTNIENWCLMLNEKFEFNKFRFNLRDIKKVNYILNNYSCINNEDSNNNELYNLVDIILSNGTSHFSESESLFDKFRLFYYSLKKDKDHSRYKFIEDNSLLYKNNYIKIYLYKPKKNPNSLINKYTRQNSNFSNIVEIELFKSNIHRVETFLKNLDIDIFMDVKTKLELMMFKLNRN